MIARDLLERPDFKIPESEVQDALFMIDLLSAWIRARSSARRVSSTTIAGTLLCPIFRSEKGTKYASAADEYRAAFKGIAEDTEKVGDFFGTFRDEILEVAYPSDVYDKNFSHYFNARTSD